MRDFLLHTLSPEEFEGLVVKICHRILGTGTFRFSSGPDGGRDGRFEGTAKSFPSPAEPWSGRFVIQAKRTEKADASCSDGAFTRLLKKELPKVRALRESGQCDCYLLFTNRKLTAVKESELLPEMREQTGVERVAILGRETITTYLEGAPEVAEAAGLWVSPLVRGRPTIPPAKRDFTGRTEELADLRREIGAHGGALIYGVRGLGGVGKTELAFKLVEEVGAEYPDGQVLVELGGASDRPLTVTEAMAEVIRAFEPQVRLPDAEAELRRIYHRVLRDRRAVLLLDDAASVEQVEPLLPHRGCLTLVTSRQRFALPALYRQDLDALTPEAARELLLRLAPRLGTAEEIAALLGRLPLALRLAGSAFAERPGLKPAEYLKRLEFLEERVGLVAAVIDFSYSALGSELRRRWRMLAVFPGGFDAAGAGAVWDLDAAAAEEVLGGELLRVSLVEHRDGRYRLHDLARDFAATRLEAGEGDTAGLRHAGHYAAVLERTDRLYLDGGEGIAAGLALYDREWGNVRAGQAWASAHAAGDREAARLCSEYPGVGAYCLEMRLHPAERIRWLEAARQAAAELGDRGAEGRHLGNLGIAYADLGEARRAIEYYEQRLAIAREIGDRRGEGNALGNLGLAYADLGEQRRAAEYHEQRLAIVREIGDRWGEGQALGNLGIAYAAFGEARRAIEYYEQHLTIAREIGDRRGEGQALGNLGNAYADLGEVCRAIEYHEQRLEIAREIGDRRGEGNALGNLGLAYAALGEPRVIEYYEQRLAIAREIGDRQGDAIGSWNLGKEYEKMGELDRAAELMQVRVDFEREIGHSNAEKHAERVAQLRRNSDKS